MSCADFESEDHDAVLVIRAEDLCYEGRNAIALSDIAGDMSKLKCNLMILAELKGKFFIFYLQNSLNVERPLIEKVSNSEKTNQKKKDLQ